MFIIMFVIATISLLIMKKVRGLSSTASLTQQPNIADLSDKKRCEVLGGDWSNSGDCCDDCNNCGGKVTLCEGSTDTSVCPDYCKVTFPPTECYKYACTTETKGGKEFL